MGQVEGKRIGGDPEVLGDPSRGKTKRSLPDEQPEERQARGLGQRRKRPDGCFYFHSSNIVEV
jgi:hypothetical protein